MGNDSEEVLFYVANYYSKAKSLYKVAYTVFFKKYFLKQDTLFGLTLDYLLSCRRKIICPKLFKYLGT